MPWKRNFRRLTDDQNQRPKRTMTCRNCQRDLSISTNSEAYRLKLESESIPHNIGPVTDFAAEPEITEPLYFCTFLCLHSWIDQ